MRWGESETAKFVKIYAKHENLWNPQSLHHKVREERLKSYRQMISEFKVATGVTLTLSELTSKIKVLRCTYVLEMGKIAKRARSGSTYRTRIKWFSDMHECLRNIVKPKNVDITLINSLSSEDLIQGEWDTDRINMESDSNDGQKVWVPNMSGNEGDNESDFVPQSQFFTDMDLDKVQVKTEKDRTFKTRHKKIKRHTPSSDQSFIDSIIPNTALGVEDEFDIYGKYIASQLRSLDLKNALRIKLQIQGLVSEARIEELRQYQE
ncbi:uncharacterized protein LOC121735424 [Aricia agestis]|uniref:uncharacterized protein LOC121735424 n=1 Tax=Aricia agestis TaxID=91739 RepID=UPI001C203517|nr:uncharacterized protein LOC121735424 [Aricia agestis]